MKYMPPWIPKDAKWYLADIVVEITVEGAEENSIENNLKLVRADSPEEAYEKAMLLGKDEEISYDNTDGAKVTFRFRGLRDLYVIYDELEHGAEILYWKYDGLSEDAVTKMITPKEQLSVFTPREIADSD